MTVAKPPPPFPSPPHATSSPATAILNNRWAQLPQSENAQMELITSRARHTANLTLMPPSRTTAAFPKILSKTEYAHLGELIRQEHLAGSSQMLCHYRNSSAPTDAFSSTSTPISLVCELGCCPNESGGCCTMELAAVGDRIAATPSSYHWTMVLLSFFIVCVFVSTLTMLLLYLHNRRHEKRVHRRRLAEKCFSVSSSAGLRYGAPSMATAASTPSVLGANNAQQLYNPAFRRFFNSPEGSPRQFASSHSASPAHLLRPCHPNHDDIQRRAHLHHSPSPSSSAYQGLDEMFFRSSF